MQHRVHFSRENLQNAIALPPRRAKPVRVVAAAEEARAMPGRERGCLVEKEQFGPAAAAHHLAPPSPEFADTGQPRLAGPAPVEGFGGGIVNDAAIAGEYPAMRGGDDVAGWGDAVLQGHLKTRPLVKVGIACDKREAFAQGSTSDEAIQLACCSMDCCA